jgi:hypothetical protein
MDQFTRRLVGIGVHRGTVTGADLCRMFNAAIHGRVTPRHLSTDHDPVVSRASGELDAKSFTLLGRSNSAAHRDVGVAALD